MDKDVIIEDQKKVIDHLAQKLVDAEARLFFLRDVVSAARHVVIWCEKDHQSLRRALEALDGMGS